MCHEVGTCQRWGEYSERYIHAMKNNIKVHRERSIELKEARRHCGDAKLGEDAGGTLNIVFGTTMLLARVIRVWLAASTVDLPAGKNRSRKNNMRESNQSNPHAIAKAQFRLEYRSLQNRIDISVLKCRGARSNRSKSTLPSQYPPQSRTSRASQPGYP